MTSSIKEYTIENICGAKFTCAIDHSVCTDEHLHAINGFWSEDEYRLQDADGDIAIAVVKFLAKTCFNLQKEHHGLNNYGIMNCFNWDAKYGMQGVEGWPHMDGRHGIVITRCDEPDWDLFLPVVKPLTAMPEAPKRPEW